MKHIDFNKIASKICESDVKGSVRTAGQIEFKKDRGPIRRDIRAPGFKWSPESLRNLAKILWAIQRSNSYTMAAYRVFSKMNSSDFSPDGLLGGLEEYVLPVVPHFTGGRVEADRDIGGWLVAGFGDRFQNQFDGFFV